MGPAMFPSERLLSDVIFLARDWTTCPQLCHVHLFQNDSCENDSHMQPACVRSPRSGDWHFYDSAHPRQRQRGPRDSSAHHAHHHMQVKCARPPFVRLSSSPASIWTYVLSALPSLAPANFMSLLCIKKKKDLWVYEFHIELQNCCESFKNECI